MKVIVAIVTTYAVGAGAITGGVFMLAGPGWAAIAGGAAMLGITAVLRMGLPNG